MKFTWGRVFRRLGLPFWTFLGIGLSGVLINYIGLSLEMFIRDGLNALGLRPYWVDHLPPALVIASVVIVVALIAAWQGRRATTRGHTQFGLDRLPLAEGKAGIIIMVSNVQSAMRAVQYHYQEKGALRYVWLLPSNDMEKDCFGSSTIELAKQISAKCAQLQAEVELAEGKPRPLAVMEGNYCVSPADAQDTYDMVNRIYRTVGPRLGLETQDIIADFTGGTKPMTVGMIMACLPVDRELEYVAFNLAEKRMSGPFVIDYQHSAFDLIG